MPKSDNGHPSAQQLAAFDSGLLRPSEWEALERHVAGCAACCERLEALPEDSMVTLLRSSAAPPHRPETADTRDLTRGCADTPVTPPGLVVDVPKSLAGHPRYRVLKQIGAGGMGAVFKAEHRLMERMVALKVIRPELTDKPGAVERFRTEVKAAARLSHAHIVTAYDADQAGDVHFLVMEYVEGESLDKVIQRRGPLPVAEACDIVRQAASGLQHAFERGMVHRDIQPANILLLHPSPERERRDRKTPVANAPGSDGGDPESGAVVKILDFGLARFASERSPSGSLTPVGAVVGTPDYIAPEQALEPQKADIRADIYSLGCTLYHLLAGRPPFPEGTALQKLMSHQERKPNPVSEVRAGLPEDLLRVLDRMMAKDPARRYQTPAAVVEALTPFVAPKPASSQTSPRRRGLLILLAVAASLGMFLAVAGLVAVIWQRTHPHVTVPGDQPGPGTVLFPDELHRFGGKSGPYTAAAFDRMATLALTGGADHVLRLWDLDSDEEIAQLVGHTNAIVSIDFSYDKRSAISADRDNHVRVWDLANRRQTAELSWTDGKVRSVGFTWDNRHAWIAGDNGTVAIWNTAEVQKPLQRHSLAGRIEGAALDRYGTYLAAGGPDGAIRIRNMAKKQSGPELIGHRAAVTCAAWSADARYLLSGGMDNTLRLWRAATGKELRKFQGHSGAIRCVALSRNVGWAISGGDDGSVRLWDVDSGKELRAFPGHDDAVVAVAFSINGRRAYSAAKDGTVRVWKLPGGYDDISAPFGDVAASVALSEQSVERTEVLAKCGGDETVKLFTMPDRKPLATLTGHTHMVVSVALSRDGSTAASGSWDKTVKLWNVADGTTRHTLKGHAGVVRAVAFSADGSTLASAGADQTIRLWEVATGKPQGTLKGHTGAVWSLAFSDDGKTLVSAGTDQTVRTWDVDGRKQLRMLTGHKGPVWAVAITRDGKYIASGGDDQTVRMWYTDTGRAWRVLPGHQGAVRAVAFSRDGRGLASGSLDGTTRLWDVASGRPGSQMEKTDDAKFTSLAFQNDGKLLVAGTADGNVKMWELTPK
jgi:WD40 repeat protein